MAELTRPRAASSLLSTWLLIPEVQLLDRVPFHPSISFRTLHDPEVITQTLEGGDVMGAELLLLPGLALSYSDPTRDSSWAPGQHWTLRA